MTGLCECGCGKRTKPAPRTDSRKGWVKGQPMRYLSQHHRRGSPVEYIEDANGCWIWQRALWPNGYGQAWDGARSRGAHRVVYERHLGPIPDGLQLDHLCRVSACVNPAHLEPVTNAANTQRGERAKLSWPSVRAIRATTGVPVAELARRYGVSCSAIDHVLTRRRWREFA